MIHAGGETALSKESRPFGGTTQRPAQRLQRDMAAAVEILGLPDLAHPTTAKEAFNVVVPEPLPGPETRVERDLATRRWQRFE
jgi:hypothetical protein